MSTAIRSRHIVIAGGGVGVIEALLALRDLSDELAASYQVRLEARCGICSGDVVVITMPGGDMMPEKRGRNSSAPNAGL